MRLGVYPVIFFIGEGILMIKFIMYNVSKIFHNCQIKQKNDEGLFSFSHSTIFENTGYLTIL